MRTKPVRPSRARHRSPEDDLTGQAARQRREAARARDLTALLQQRPDLAGVHLPADFTAETVRWCI